jgi:hypothetical protein
MMDFDKFFEEEIKQEGLKIKLFNSEYELPYELPLKVIFLFRKIDKLSVDENVEICKLIVSEKIYNEWFEKGITFSQLNEIITWIIQEKLKNEDAEIETENNDKKK